MAAEQPRSRNNLTPTSGENFHGKISSRLPDSAARGLRQQSEGFIRYRAVGREAVQQAARYETLSANRRRICQLALRESGEDSFGGVGESALAFIKNLGSVTRTASYEVKRLNSGYFESNETLVAWNVKDKDLTPHDLTLCFGTEC
jgi:hypothetical protein